MTDRWVGKVLGGRYQIEELLGQGGMSAVYKARDPNLRRTVAIKLIHPHLSDNEEFVRRFESEATAVARLRHPNIVQVFDFNHDNDVYYMVLEFVAGETLGARIKRLNASGRRVGVRDALRAMIDICHAADYAHQRGMIHRDIKPANIMLDVNGSAILMDFGIAHMLGGQGHTATGAVLGTALYMSPEQIQGLHPDARSDIYSLGVTLFETLGGRPPFEADSAMTLMMMHLHDPVPDLDALHPGIPEDVRAIVNRALEKDRADRFQSCAEMAAALEQVLQTLPAEKEKTAPVPPPVKEAKPAKPARQPAKEPAPQTFVEPTPPPATFVESPAAAAAPPSAAYTGPGGGATIVEQTGPAVSPRADATIVEQAPAWQAPAAPPAPAQKRRVPVAAIAAIAVLLLAAGFAIFRLVSPPVAAAPTQTQAAAALPSATLPVAAPLPTETLEPTLAPSPLPTDTPAPTQTPEPTATEAPPALPEVGGADQVAFVLNSDIWVANVDGTEARQLTSDGAVKHYLRWLPAGDGLSYISGKCLQTADFESGEVATITCFNNATYFDSFEVSPDGTRVALSLDRQLYLLPFDLERLSHANSHPDLVAMADCLELAPYQRNAVLSARWSRDGSQLAAIALGVLADGRRGEVVQIFAVDQCIANPRVQVQFPEPHFTFSAYSHTPALTGFTWDGESLFAMNGDTRNAGFGDLQLFNRETFKAVANANPIGGVCCYRDPTFSPDGNYVLLAFQDITLGANSQTQLYYLSYGSFGTGAKYQPLPLPAFTNPKEAPQAVLRPVRP